MSKTVAIVGATGAVGQTILSLLDTRHFPIQTLRLFASPASEGKSFSFQNTTVSLEILQEHHLEEIDLFFFCAGSSVSKEWIPKILQKNKFIIDSSSAFRLDPQVPLIIPEINGHMIKNDHRLIASPNCAATILLMPLFTLHRKFKARRLIVSTYQAASGAGTHLLQELKKETKAYLEEIPYNHFLPFPYAFNLYPHNSFLHPNGYVEEELKIAQETKKILGDDSIRLSATCVRVPILRAHSLSANVEFSKPFEFPEVYESLKTVPGLKLFEDRDANRFATPHDATGQNDIFCGRFRKDPTQENTLEFWAVGDQLLKGAALNALQIAEMLVQQQKITLHE